MAAPDTREEARLEAQVRAAVRASGRKLVALDDDPTGVQTVANVAVLARWEVVDLATELQGEAPLFFILTNSRSLSAPDASALNREIAANLVAASRETKISFAIASRSDSTLRGHFPAETDAIAAELGGVDGVLLCPAFFEGGRVTINDVHYLRDGERLIPVNETEFARDATFGYRHANLRQWVEEKTNGRIPADAVRSLSLDDLQTASPVSSPARPMARCSSSMPPAMPTSMSSCSVCYARKRRASASSIALARPLFALARGYRLSHRCAGRICSARAPRPCLGWSSLARMSSARQSRSLAS